MKLSTNIGSIIGIPIEVNHSWVLIFGLVTWTLAAVYFPAVVPDLSGFEYFIAAVISSILLFVSILLHELSHCFIAQKNSISIKKITLFIFGGVAQMDREPESPKVEFEIAIVGPASSLIISVAALILAWLFSSAGANPMFNASLKYLAVVNLSIALFNLLPGFPLDGGRIFRAVIWHFNNNLRAATRAATVMGKSFSYVFMAAGLFYLFMMQLITGIWLLIIGLFIYEAADIGYQQVILKKALVGIPVKDVMTKDVTTVSSEITIDRLVNDYFYKHRHMGFPVADNGKLKGMVLLKDVKSIPQENWDKTKAEAILSPIREDLLIGPDCDCLDALFQVTKSGLGRLLVVENGILLGIIGQRDLVKLFEIKTHLCK